MLQDISLLVEGDKLHFGELKNVVRISQLWQFISHVFWPESSKINANIEIIIVKNIEETQEKMLEVIAKVKIGVKKSSTKSILFFVKGTFLAKVPNGKMQQWFLGEGIHQ